MSNHQGITAPEKAIVHRPSSFTPEELNQHPNSLSLLDGGVTILNHRNPHRLSNERHPSKTEQEKVVDRTVSNSSSFTIVSIESTSFSDTTTTYDPLCLTHRKVHLDTSKKSKHKKKIIDFYQDQNEFIQELLDHDKEKTMNNKSTTFIETEKQKQQKEKEKREFKLKIAVYGSVLGNTLLFGLQLYAAITSKSFSLFATMADAFMDLASSLVIVLSEYIASRKVSPWKYPTGRKRLEIMGIIVFAVFMTILAVQLAFESTKKLILKEFDMDLEPMAFVCIGIALCVKIVLFFYCKALSDNPTARIFALDHRNDIILNVFGVILSLMGYYVVWWLDPLGGLLIALLILKSWSGAAFEHMELILGKSADTKTLQKLTYIALTHDDRIQGIDTVRAYHLGHSIYVEIDIILPPDMNLKEAHDIGECLQMKLEKLEFVERAFVHTDYEYTHAPEHQKID